jgi:AraC-like DNA-binding protein
MDRDYAEPLQTSDLAAAALSSPAHFVRRFKVAFGETPHMTVGHPSRTCCPRGSFPTRPTGRPYDIEATFRDNSGNWFSLTRTHRPG